MKIELNQEELSLLIECVTDSKNGILEMLEKNWDYEYPLMGDITDLTNYLENLYIVKNKLCNYSIENREEL